MPEHRKYGSKHAALRIDARGAEPILHPATGTMVGRHKALVAEFGVLGPEYTPRDEDGEPLYHDGSGRPYVTADIRGHFWDSQIAQAENGWTDDETDAVIQQVEYFCRTQPRLVWRLEDPVLVQPWPTFNDQSDQEAVATAIATGQVEPALAYAAQEKRKKVVSELKAYLAEQAAESEAAESLTAA